MSLKTKETMTKEVKESMMMKLIKKNINGNSGFVNYNNRF